MFDEKDLDNGFFTEDGDYVDEGVFAEIGEEEAPSLAPFQDDFEATLQRKADAQVLPGYGQLDSLGAAVQEQIIENGQSDALAPPVRVTPLSANNSVLGNQAQVQSGQVSQDMVFLTGENREATATTITISRIDSGSGTSFVSSAATATAFQSTSTQGIPAFPTPNTSGTPFSYRPFARIRFGTRDYAAEFECDIGQGCQLTVNGASVFVRVGMDPAQPGYLPGTMQLTASLGFWTTFRSAPCTRTVYLDQVNGTVIAPVSNDVRSFVIPAFARTLLPIQYSAASSTFLIEIMDVSGTVLQTITVSTTQPMQPTPLANDAYQVRFTSTGNPPGNSASAIFALSV